MVVADSAALPPVPGRAGHSRAWIDDVKKVDEALYSAVVRTPTPRLDRSMSSLSQAANYSRLWIGSAAVLALVGGNRGRRTAVHGLLAVAATSAVVNLAVKRTWRRSRPPRPIDHVPQRYVRMPDSLSFPSGHSAAAFAFATAVGQGLPVLAVPVRAAAGLVAYSRVHTGVHYPGDVVVGSMLGTVLAQLTSHALDRYTASR
jgi:undecaprenyl-diphosphatase